MVKKKAEEGVDQNNNNEFSLCFCLCCSKLTVQETCGCYPLLLYGSKVMKHELNWSTACV